MSITHYFNLLIGLLAMINPIAVAPIFLALTQHQTRQERYKTALQGALASGVILTVSLLLGNLLLKLFGIGIPAFQVAGGLLVLSFGLAMAQGKDTKHQPAEREEGDSIAVVPLALPVTTGPGVISAVIVYASANNAMEDIVSSLIIIWVAAAVIYATFRYAPTIAARIGPDGMSIATRISGLILAAIGVQFIAMGLSDLLPGLR